jgi:hypothetical protein
VKSRLFSFHVIPVFSGMTPEKLFTKPPAFGRFVLPLKTSFIFLFAQENGTKRKRPCHEPFGCAVPSPHRPDAPELAPLIAALRQPPRLFRPVQRCAGLVTMGNGATSSQPSFVIPAFSGITAESFYKKPPFGHVSIQKW